VWWKTAQVSREIARVPEKICAITPVKKSNPLQGSKSNSKKEKRTSPQMDDALFSYKEEF